MEQERNQVPEEASVALEAQPVSRRSFLDYVIGGSFTILGLAAATTVIAYVLPPRRQSTGSTGRTEIGSVASLPAGKATKVSHQGKAVIVGHTTQGFFALSAVCTHLGCIVEWNQAKQQLQCPCHAAVFDTRGNVLSGPAPSPLPSYEVLVSDGKIYIS